MTEWDTGASREPDPLLGRVLGGRFELRSLIGRGAMGAVYLAQHQSLEEPVAVKVMHAELAAQPSFAERFYREAKMAVRLTHPSCVRVFDFGEEKDGVLYIAMEYLEGRDLARIIAAESPLPPKRIAVILRQVLAALGAAHEAGIVHRDIKPENIMVGQGKDEEGEDADSVKVCDFGIAKATDARASRVPGQRGAAPLTTAGLVVGTPEYLSPEQGRGESIDARSDLYSVGVVLYEMLTGRVPFEAESAIGIVLKHVSEEPVPPSSIVRVDPTLEAVCLRALSKPVAGRFQTAREMRSALRDVAEAPRDRLTAAPATPRAIAARPTAATQTSLAVPASGVPESSASIVAAAVDPPAAPPGRRRRAVSVGIVSAIVVASLAGVLAVVFGRSTAASSKHSASSTLVASRGSDLRADQAAPPSTPVSSVATARPLATLLHGALPSAPAPSSENASPAASATATIAMADVPAPTPPPSPEPPAPPPDTAAATPDPPAAPPPPPPPAAPSFDPSTGRVSIAGISAQGARPRDVGSVVGHALGRMTACYQAALRSSSDPRKGRGSVHIDTDGAGTITNARASVGFAPDIAACVQRSLVGLRVPGVDTGEASADIGLSFDVH